MITKSTITCTCLGFLFNCAFSATVIRNNTHVCQEIQAINQDLTSYHCQNEQPPKNPRLIHNLTTLANDQEAINKICQKGKFGKACSENHLASSLYTATSSLASISQKQIKSACQYGFVESNKDIIRYFTAPYHC